MSIGASPLCNLCSIWDVRIHCGVLRAGNVSSFNPHFSQLQKTQLLSSEAYLLGLNCGGGWGIGRSQPMKVNLKGCRCSGRGLRTGAEKRSEGRVVKAEGCGERGWLRLPG